MNRLCPGKCGLHSNFERTGSDWCCSECANYGHNRGYGSECTGLAQKAAHPVRLDVDNDAERRLAEIAQIIKESRSKTCILCRTSTKHEHSTGSLDIDRIERLAKGAE